jgi:hypothetical protein
MFWDDISLKKGGAVGSLFNSFDSNRNKQHKNKNKRKLGEQKKSLYFSFFVLCFGLRTIEVFVEEESGNISNEIGVLGEYSTQR